MLLNVKVIYLNLNKVKLGLKEEKSPPVQITNLNSLKLSAIYANEKSKEM